MTKKIKDLTVFFLLLGASQYSWGQAAGTPYIIPTQDIPFSFLAGGTEREMTLNMATTADGGYITLSAANSSVTGDVTDANHGTTTTPDAWVVKYDKYGKIEWQRMYGGSLFETGAVATAAIKQTSEGGYIFTIASTSSASGDVTGTGKGAGDIWVVKITATGAITWQRLYGGSGGDNSGGIIQTADGGYLVGGFTRSSANGDVTSTRNSLNDFDFWAIKITATGAITWQQTYTNPGPANSTNDMSDYMNNLEAAIDGSGYIMAGRSNSNYRNTSSSYDYFIMKINLTGATQWRRLYGSSGQDDLRSMYLTSDGGYILVGNTDSSTSGDLIGTNHGGDDIWVIKANAAGTIEWQRLLGGTGIDDGQSVIQTSDGGYMIAGISTSSANGDITDTNKGSYDITVFKLSSTGATQWMKLYGGSSVDGDNRNSLSNGGSLLPTRIRETDDGNYIVFGSSGSSDNGDVTDTNNGVGGTTNYDQWLFKIDQSGNIVWVPDVGQKN
ncbi:hypothetical protein [Chryseobacterium sp. Leaf405]|uniref:hypothetical protein n=1 Tax=Chryseobacterium sp. Leaf405 TaxID=1736367 RepID=UPI00103DFE34|nr:hypothetical protein [Chryseobacterium sp. Leaf405]